MAAPEVERQRAARGRGREALEQRGRGVAPRHGLVVEADEDVAGPDVEPRRAAADGRRRERAVERGAPGERNARPRHASRARAAVDAELAAGGRAAAGRRARAPEERVDGRERVLGVRPHEVLQLLGRGAARQRLPVDGHEHVAGRDAGRARRRAHRRDLDAPRRAHFVSERHGGAEDARREPRAPQAREPVLGDDRGGGAAAAARDRHGPRDRRVAAAQRCVRVVVRIVRIVVAALGRLFCRVDDVQPVEELRHRSVPMRGSPSSATVPCKASRPCLRRRPWHCLHAGGQPACWILLEAQPLAGL